MQICLEVLGAACGITPITETRYADPLPVVQEFVRWPGVAPILMLPELGCPMSATPAIFARHRVLPMVERGHGWRRFGAPAPSAGAPAGRSWLHAETGRSV